MVDEKPIEEIPPPSPEDIITGLLRRAGVLHDDAGPRARAILRKLRAEGYKVLLRKLTPEMEAVWHPMLTDSAVKTWEAFWDAADD